MYQHQSIQFNCIFQINYDDENNVFNLVIIIQTPTQFSAAQLEIVFKVGDHVKVALGEHMDKMGMILKIVDDKATLLFDITQHIFETFTKNLRSARDVTNTTEVHTPSLYEINDLVSLSKGTEAAIVLKIDKVNLTVLTSDSFVKTVKPTEIISKINTKRSILSDSSGNAVCFGDQIIVTGRNLDENRGTVVHLYKSVVFCQSKDKNDRNGIFVVRAGDITLLNAQNNTHQVCFFILYSCTNQGLSNLLETKCTLWIFSSSK